MILTACALLLAAAAPGPPVAVVVSLTGEASIQAPASAPTRPLLRFEWLPSGATIAVGTGSTLVLAFADGSRRELLANARASLGDKGLASSEGSVRELASLPPLPDLPPLAADSGVSRAGAVRIRGLRIAGLYPREGWCGPRRLRGAALRPRPRGRALQRSRSRTKPGRRCSRPRPTSPA